MAGFGFGYAHGSRQTQKSQAIGQALSQTIGALTRNQFGAGVPTTGSAIVSGDAGGHWAVSGGRLFPSVAGDAADLNASPYALEFDDGSTLNITIEPNTWDITDQSEWDFVAKQSAATLAGKTIALRNTSTLNLGITGGFNTPFRRVELRAGSVPLTIKGRLGATGEFNDYCEIDRVQQLRGARGIRFEHLRTTAVAEQKFRFVGEASNHIEDITIHDCWVRGQPADPNGNFSNSSNYPNLNIDLIATTGSAAGSVGNITVTDSLIEWGDSLINVTVDKPGNECVITGNEAAFFYGDAIGVSTNPANPVPTTISDNFLHDSVGLATDSANPHADVIRLIGTNSFIADWDNIQIERNICLQGTARGDIQGIFLDDMKTGSGDSGHFFIATIRNNIVGVNLAGQGISVLQAKNCVIDNNTLFSWNEASVVSTPGINIAPSGGATSTDGGGNVVSDNIADTISAPSAALSNNFVAGKNGETIPYTDLFDGPTFAPTTAAIAKTLLNPKVNAGALIT